MACHRSLKNIIAKEKRMAKYDVDSQLLISGKIREIYENEDGVFYQLKVKHRDGAVNLSIADKFTLPETGTYNIDDYVYIVGKTIEIFKNDDGTFYNLRIKHSTGTTNLMIEEQYIKGVKSEDENTNNEGENGSGEEGQGSNEGGENQGGENTETPQEPEPSGTDPEPEPNTGD